MWIHCGYFGSAWIVTRHIKPFIPHRSAYVQIKLCAVNCYLFKYHHLLVSISSQSLYRNLKTRVPERRPVVSSWQLQGLKLWQEKWAGLPHPKSSVWRIIGLLFAMFHLAAVHTLLWEWSVCASVRVHVRVWVSRSLGGGSSGSTSLVQVAVHSSSCIKWHPCVLPSCGTSWK